MAKPTSYLSTRFGAANIGKQLITEAYVPKLVDRGFDVINALEEPINELVDGFFRDLAGRMGSVEDLAALEPDVPGVRPWTPLSISYVRRKGTAQFWIYALAPKTQTEINARVLKNLLATRKAGTGKLRKPSVKTVKKGISTITGEPLIGKLERLSGLDQFGACEIKMVVTDEVTSIPVDDKEQRLRSKAAAAEGVKPLAIVSRRFGASTKKFPRYARFYDSITRVKLKVTIRLWTNFNNSQLKDIETRLPGLGVRDVQKLLGKVEYRRPLILPFMAYYSRILVPNLIRDTVGHALENVSVKGKKSFGPL